MTKEKRITNLIKKIIERRMTISVKNVVVCSIISKGIPLNLADDKELIQSIINKTQES